MPVRRSWSAPPDAVFPRLYPPEPPVVLAPRDVRGLPPLPARPLGAPGRPSATLTNLHSFNTTQTSEEGRSTTSGATLFMHVRRRPTLPRGPPRSTIGAEGLIRRRPTLPRGPPRSTIGAEGLNFRVRNGTGCFPFAITAETLLRCHRALEGSAWRPYLGNRTVDAKSNGVEAKPLGLLVPVSCTRCRASTSGLSTQSSTGGLTWLTQRETSS